MPKTMPKSPREGLTAAKVFRFLSLPFRPDRLKAYRSVDRFVDIAIAPLLADGIRGVLLDADGTLAPHHSQAFSPAVMEHVHEMTAAGLKVAIFTNANDDRFEQFQGVSVVTGVPAKPDPRGFLTAMRKHLGLDDPKAVCMIGDNYITDGGAISAGMRFIHVRPLPGPEKWAHRTLRAAAYYLARLYHPRPENQRKAPCEHP
ncbi:MAG: HAD family hydrolase [Nitrospinaceae bacterium]|jgi:HAD superfamily phosphatase (TIGR01668 family)|nr:MAG: HAD family hydrolase [Nitrospinaceae bacterium]